MDKTKIRNLAIDSFRSLKNIEIPIANRITVICGKNGTSKSSLLGLAAHGFSFRKDHTSGEALKFSPLAYTKFESAPKEHFRLSKRYDSTGSMSVKLNWFDGYTKKEQSLKLKFYNYADRDDPRVVARDNTSIESNTGRSSNTSVKATHPVIYLSLKRLLPIAFREKYEPKNEQYFEDNKTLFINISRQILNKLSISNATQTSGTLASAAPHGENYDYLSVSVGEDNVGQIALAILSFLKLKTEYNNYKGGLLLIDEADAGLFPAAQLSFIHTLSKYCKQLDLQVIITTHSPLIIEEVHRLSLLGGTSGQEFKTLYLTDSYGDLEIRENMSWPEIYADLLQQTIDISPDTSLPKVNLYCEDLEGHDFFNALVRKKNVRKCLNNLKKVKLGGDQYISLAAVKVPEFSIKSIVVLDGDKVSAINKKLKNKHSYFVTFPSSLPPDQLIFELLYNLPAAHSFWINSYKFTKPVFEKLANNICSELCISEIELNLEEKIQSVSLGAGKVRTLFKSFYNTSEIQKLVGGKLISNPFHLWVTMNPEKANDFLMKIEHSLRSIYLKSHGISSTKLTFLDDK